MIAESIDSYIEIEAEQDYTQSQFMLSVIFFLGKMMSLTALIKESLWTLFLYKN